MKTIQDFKTGTTNLSKFDYTYDAEGEITTFKRQNDTSNAALTTITQDLADQLTAETVKDTVKNTVLSTYSYGYDLGSNRTSDSRGIF